MKRQGLTRRAFLGGALCMPAILAARADCAKPTLRIRVRRNFESFDPADAWGEDAIITRNLLAPLVRFTRRQGSDQWGWERHIVDSISEGDARRCQFKLRDEGWQSSSSVSTEDVAFSFERIAGLNGGLSDAGNKRSWSALQSVEITNAQLATITLRSDRSDLLTTVLPGVAGCVVNKSYVTGLSEKRFRLDPGPTSGRYDLCAVEPGVNAKLTKDESWKGDKVKVDSAVFIVIQDDNAAKEMFLSGEIDVYRPGLDVLKLAVAQGDPVVRTPTSRTSILVLNQQGPLANPEVRKAIQLAVDRKAVAVEAYSDGDASVATGLVPSGWTGWSKEQLVPFDPDEAQRLVSMNNPQETLRIAVWPDPVFIRIGEQVRSDLEKAGLRSEVITQEPANFWYAIAQNAADILVTRTPSQTTGALATFEEFTSSSQLGWNKNPEFDSVFSKADAEPSEDLFLQLQRSLTDNGVVVPLVDDQAAYLVARNIQPAFHPDGEIGDLGSWERL
jgi:ABC-type transport system substrate-binding protein